MGTTEEASKAVGSFFDIMKTQPLSLALVIMNLALLWILWSNIERGQEELKMMYSAQATTQQLLSHCVVPDK